MRFIFLFTCFIFMSSGLEAQKDILDKKVTALYNEQLITDILVDISKKLEVNISFDPSIFEFQKPLTIQIKRERLGDVLDVLLADMNAEYYVDKRQVIILKKDTNPIASQELREIYGYVEDQESRERLPYATVFTEDQKRIVYANEYGFYRIKIPDTITYLYTSYIGYKEIKTRIDRDSSYHFLRLLSSNRFEEVTISDFRLDPQLNDYDLHVKADMKRIESTNQFAGLSDIVRSIQSMPGVSSGADGLGGFSVRGANVENNLILLDGVPVYNATHSLGVLSIFNQSTIKSTQFYRSHIPSQYGGRLASVLDIRTKEGSLASYKGSVEIGVITASAHIEGPIVRDRLSFILSGRRTLLEPYIGPISSSYKLAGGREGSLGYYFGDFNAKLQYVINQRNRLYLSHYRGLDSFDDSSSSIASSPLSSRESVTSYDWQWGNQLTSLRWAAEISSSSFSQLTLYASNYNFRASNFESSAIDTFEMTSFYQLDGSIYDTQIQDYGLKWDYDKFLDKFNTLKLGISVVHHNFTPGVISARESDRSITIAALNQRLNEQLDIPERRANEVEGYLDNTYRSDLVTAQYGVRLTVLNTPDRNYWNLQPRISLKTKITDGIYGKLSGNLTTQYLHLLSTTGIGLPTDIWIPSSTKIRPEIAYQAAGGFDFKLTKDVTLYTEAYYKYLRNVLNLQEGALFSAIENTNWENEIPVGIGYAYGLELGLQVATLAHYMDLNYSYGHSLRRFDEINAGDWFYDRFDRRHQIKGSYIFNLNDNIQFTSSIIHATGHPQTVPTLILDNRLVYTEKNNLRLPYYQRIDIGVQIQNRFSWGMQTIHLGVYNLLNRQNPYFYFTEFSPSNPVEVEFKQVTLFPLLPNLSYRLHF